MGLCILLVGFFSLGSWGQDSPPTNLIVFEEFVSPSDLPAFREVQQKVVDLWKKHNIDIPVYCYRNDADAFYWVVPLDNFGSIDELYKKMQAISKQMMEEDNFDGDKAFRDLSTGRQSVIRWVPELSYHPSGVYGQQNDKPYVEWTFCSLKAGHEKEAGDAIKKYIDFYNKIDDTYEWDVYGVMLGYDTPMWILMTRAESPLAMRQLEARLNEKYREDFSKMWQEFAQHLRKTENQTGWFRQAWSLNTAQ